MIQQTWSTVSCVALDDPPFEGESHQNGRFACPLLLLHSLAEAKKRISNQVLYTGRTLKQPLISHLVLSKICFTVY